MQALEINKRLDYKYGTAFTLNSKTHLQADNKLMARSCLKKALKIFEKLKVPEAIEVRGILQSF